MAKTKTSAKKTAKNVKIKTEAVKPTALLRKGALAYIGLYGAAFEAAKTRFATVRSSTDGLFDELVEKGTDIEAKASVFAKGAQLKATDRFSASTAKVRSVLPTASNDRVEELEAEVTKLNKKIAAMAKKKAAAKRVKITTEKTVKAAPSAAPSQAA